MPFKFNRDKQSPADKLSGSDDFLSDIRKKFDQDRKMFFTNPDMDSASGFSRGGFFDGVGRDGGTRDAGLGIRSHLDELAQRHPEFASSLRGGPAWPPAPHRDHLDQWDAGVDHSARPHPGAPPAADEGAASGGAAYDEEEEEPGPLRGRSRRMNATAPDVPAAGAEDDAAAGGRGQRSWSAPPDSRAAPPARFVSRLDVPPLAGQDPASVGVGQSQAQQPEPASQRATAGGGGGGGGGSNVRHIPIFVEGRDEPVLPREQPAQGRGPPNKRPFPQARSFNTSPQPFRSPDTPQAGSGPPPHKCPSSACPAQCSASQRAAPSAAAPPAAAPPAAAPVAPVAGIAKVEAIAAAVEQLRTQVSGVSCCLRTDKQYVLLDELLTRRLLELDDVDPAGREDVRSARKQAIRAVQECISQLEAKVPLPASDEAAAAAVDQSEGAESPADQSGNADLPADQSAGS